MRWLQAAILAGLVIIGGSIAPPTHADSGWVRDWRGTWVRYSFRFHHPAGLLGAPLLNLYALQTERAVIHARRAHATYLERLRTLLAQAQASIDIAQATIGFPASCVASAEEGGSNSSAGYFGFVYPPASYGPVAAGLAGTYGSSWLNWPWSAQLQVALDLFRRYGGSAWGPTTRSKCGI